MWTTGTMQAPENRSLVTIVFANKPGTEKRMKKCVKKGEKESVKVPFKLIVSATEKLSAFMRHSRLAPDSILH